ncbi:MAG: hypothetical protein IT323_06950 [Anaerolineae bacterium]|nr:hypothetical protein [Anaerolineae bacterium]
MTEKEVKGRLSLVRFGGLVVTIMTFVILVAMIFLFGQLTTSGGQMVQDALLYIVLGTVIAAVVSIVFYFLYRAYLMRRMQS